MLLLLCWSVLGIKLVCPFILAPDPPLYRHVDTQDDTQARTGYPLTRKELTFETKKVLDLDGRKTPFKDNLPGKGWFKAFKARNPDLAERTPAALGYQRAGISLDMLKDNLLRNLHEYFVIIPKTVTADGQFVSYNVKKDQTGDQTVRPSPGRHRRAAAATPGNQEILTNSDISEYRIFYKFSVFGKEFHFDLTLNTAFLSPEFAIEYHDRDSVTRTAQGVANCYYIGQSREPFISTAAISNCYGLQGVFSTDDEDYFVEPLWNHTNKVEQEGHPHVVYKRSSLKLQTAQAHCGVTDKASTSRHKWIRRHFQFPTSSTLHQSVQSTQPGSHNSILHQLKPRKVYDIPKHNPQANQTGSSKSTGARRKRDVTMVMPERTVETLVVVDRMMYEFHKSDNILTPYVLTIMNIVAKLYRDPSIGNSINIVVSKLLVLTEDKENLSISHHADKSLDSFCKWQFAHNLTSTPTHDNAVLLTRYDICTYKNKPCGTLGLAPVAGMCEGERSCSINEDIGLASAFTIAHEMGHNFGMQHDGAGNLCGTPGQEPARIMAARLTSDLNPFLWSNCSRQYITDFLESGRGSCLESVSPGSQQADMPSSDVDIEQDANEQCRLQFHLKSRACEMETMCRELRCLDEDGQCITNSIPAGDGTPCRNNTHSFIGKCYRRQCRKLGYRHEPVDGGWSQWSAFSDCSRTCGGGVMSRQRICDNPKPAHGGKYCVGDRVKYKSCQMRQPCPAGVVDFRMIQCAEYNTIPFREKFFKWVPFTGAQSNACALNCMAEGFNFYTERASKVVDGTPCYRDRLDMCINGECRHVGCDGELGSEATEDKCRVCAGDGTSCHTISGMVDKTLPKGAYQEILKIPSGAMHIQVQEAYESLNYLALKSENGPFYINGDWTIDWPRKFTIAGTVFHYERQNDAPEIMRAIGPTSENLVVMLLLQEDNQGVQYEYNMPYTASAGNVNVTQYTWTHSAWIQCSKTCGKGISTSSAVCIHKYRQTIVEDAFCFPQPKPSHHFKHCNQEPCPSRWEIGQWSRCSQTCGGGRKTRTVVCKQLIDRDEEVILDDTECSAERPMSERICKRTNCPAMWVANEWSECSKRCGRGEMVRHVYCMTNDREMYLDDLKCENQRKPATIATCVKMACPKPQWYTRDWTECAGNCEGGWQQRLVECRSHDGDPSNKCPPDTRPIDSRRCHMDCEEASENNNDCVDNYNFAYCPLVLKFQFCDREYFVKMCCKTCRISGAIGRN